MVAELAEVAPLIDKLVAAGVNMTEPGATPPPDAGTLKADADAVRPGRLPSGPLAGMTVVVTGAMTGALEKLSPQPDERTHRTGRRQARPPASPSAPPSSSPERTPDPSGTRPSSSGVRIVAPDEFADLVAGFLDENGDRRRCGGLRDSVAGAGSRRRPITVVA